MRRRGTTWIELFRTVAGIALIAVFAFPFLVHRKQTEDDLTCVRNLLAARDGKLEAGTTCPTGGEYVQRKEGGQVVFACPAVEPHLVAGTRFVKRGDAWHTLGGLADVPLGEAEIAASWFRSVVLTADPPRVETGPSGLTTYLVAPVLVLLWFVVFVVPFGILLWKAISRRGGEGADGKGSGSAWETGVLLVFCCVMGLPAGYGITRLVRSETIELRPGEVRTRVSYPGYEGELTPFPVEACVPARHGWDVQVFVLRKGDPEETLELFTTDEERLDAIAFVHSALLPE